MSRCFHKTGLYLLLTLLFSLNGFGDKLWYQVKMDGKKIGYSWMEQKTDEGITVKTDVLVIFFYRHKSPFVINIRSKKRYLNKALVSFKLKTTKNKKSLLVKGDVEDGILVTDSNDEKYSNKRVVIPEDSTNDLQLLDIFHLMISNKLKSLNRKLLIPEQFTIKKVNIGYLGLVLSGNDSSEKVHKFILKDEAGIKSQTYFMDEKMKLLKMVQKNQKRTYEITLTAKEEAVKRDQHKLNLFCLSNKKLFYTRYAKSLNPFKGNGKGSIFLIKNAPYPNHLNGGLQNVIGEEGGKFILKITDIAEKTDRSFPDKSEYLTANRFIQSDNIKISKLALRICRRLKDAKSKIEAIYYWIVKNISWNGKVGFASALETLRRREGDCTEMSMLCTALCRAVQIPSRICVGYQSDLKDSDILKLHMWVEVFYNFSWVPIDNFIKDRENRFCRIRFFATSMKGDFKEFFNLVGKLQPTKIVLHKFNNCIPESDMAKNLPDTSDR